MSYSRRSSYSRSPLTSPYRCYGRSVSRSLSRSRSRSRSRSCDVENPGNNLYVTGLSSRITKRELGRHFSAEGRVVDVHVVVDPWTRESRGFGFVTMSSVEDADRCIKYLDGSTLDSRIINVEKARRCRGRTPTPGRYLGLKTHERRRSPSYSPRRRSPSYSPRRRSPSYSPRRRSPSYSPRRRSPSYSPRRPSSSYYTRRSPSYSPHRRSSNYYHRNRSPSYSPRHRSQSRSWSGSPQYSFERSQTRSYKPYYSRHRSNSPYYGRERSHSSYHRRHRSPSPHYSKRRDDSTHYKRRGESCSRSCSPLSGSPSSHRSRSYSSDECTHKQSCQSWERTNRCSATPRARSRTRSARS